MLSLDVLRVLATTPSALAVYAKSIDSLLEGTAACVEMNASATEIRAVRRCWVMFGGGVCTPLGAGQETSSTFAWR